MGSDQNRLGKVWRDLPVWLKWPVVVAYLVVGFVTGFAYQWTDSWPCPYGGGGGLEYRFAIGIVAGVLWPLTITETLRRLHDGPQQG